jgi:hypothetical protein
MHALPIRAKSCPPQVDILLENDILNFDNVFLRHPYFFDLKLYNKSNKLQAKFVIEP